MKERIILVLDPFGQKHIELIKEAAGGSFSVQVFGEGSGADEAREALRSAEIVVGEPDMSLLQDCGTNCPSLRFIQMTWAGTDIYTRSQLPFPKERIMLANASGAFGMIISQFVVGQALSLLLNFKAYHFQQLSGTWERRGPVKSLDGARVLVYGAGDIGSCVARRLSGFNAYVTGVCRNVSAPRPYFNELCTLDEAERHLPEADVVVGCIPNSDETAGYFDARRLGLMKQGSILVNVGRGNFVDCMALDAVLRDGSLWGAALDVTSPEPLPEDHPLWANPRCMITPHASGVGFGHLEQTEDLICGIVCDNISRYRRNEKLRNLVF